MDLSLISTEDLIREVIKRDNEVKNRNIGKKISTYYQGVPKEPVIGDFLVRGGKVLTYSNDGWVDPEKYYTTEFSFELAKMFYEAKMECKNK